MGGEIMRKLKKKNINKVILFYENGGSVGCCASNGVTAGCCPR